MDPIAIANEAVILINAALNIIGSLKANSALTDVQLLTAAQNTVNANDKLYNTLLSALSPTTPAPKV